MHTKIIFLILISIAILILVVVVCFYLIRHQTLGKTAISFDHSTQKVESENAQKIPQVNAASIHLIAVGDMMLSRNVGTKMRSLKDYSYPFKQVSRFLRSSDITFGNLESPLIAGAPVVTESMVFRADPECASALKAAGFDVLSLANNHILNQGKAGLKSTISLIKANGIQGIGAGENLKQASAPAIFEKNGLKIALLAYAYKGNQEATGENLGVAIMDINQLKIDLAEAKKQANLVIVSMHAGVEYTLSPSERQISFARAAIDAGATLVIGHHPHWVQNIEKYRDKYIIYSLGNFVFDQMWSSETREGAMASIYLNQNGVQNLEILPIKIFNYSQPQFLLNTDRNLKTRINQSGFTQDVSYVFENGEYQEKPGVYSTNQKFNPNIPSIINYDLDNDGNLESISYQEGRVSISKNQKLIWQSDPNFIITDYTIADFNHDGLPELAVALWKKGDYARNSPEETVENKEHWGSHLFLYQMQKNTLKVIWGSSLLPKPILELEAGDLNSDQKYELVVLEGDYNNPENKFSSNLSVMSWQSWGFQKDWEKQGQFANLRIYPVPEARIFVDQKKT